MNDLYARRIPYWHRFELWVDKDTSRHFHNSHSFKRCCYFHRSFSVMFSPKKEWLSDSERNQSLLEIQIRWPVSSVLPLVGFYQHNRCKEAALLHTVRVRYGKRQVRGFGQKWMPSNSPGQGENLHISGQFWTSIWIITYNYYISWRLCIFLLKWASEHQHE